MGRARGRAGIFRWRNVTTRWRRRRASQCVGSAWPAWLTLPVAPLLQAGNTYPLDAARIGIEHFKFEQPGSRDDFSANRQAACARHQIAADGVDLLGRIAHIEVVANRTDHILDIGARVGDKGAVGLLCYRWGFIVIVLVRNFADDLLDDILDRMRAHRCRRIRRRPARDESA